MNDPRAVWSRSTFRGLAALIMLVASPALARSASPPALASAADSAAICLPGPTRGIFVQLFKLTPAAAHGLFPSGARVESLASTRFAGPDLRLRLAQLAGRPSGEFAGGSASIAFFREHFKTALLSKRGDGLAILLQADSAGFDARFCAAGNGAPTGESESRRLTETGMLIVPVILGGVPHAAALHAVVVPRDSLVSMQKEFMKGTITIAAADVIDLLAGSPSTSLARCLASPSPR